jgi:hypothetical protein
MQGLMRSKYTGNNEISIYKGNEITKCRDSEIKRHKNRIFIVRSKYTENYEIYMY